MIAFLIATPLQFYNALSILALSYNNEKADFYVYSFAVNDLLRITEKASELHCVGEIINLSDYNKNKGRIGFLLELLLNDKTRFKNRIYSDLFITYTGNRNQIICNELYKNNPNLKVHFFEEGIGIYVKSFMIPEQRNALYGVLYKLVGYKRVMENISTIHVYRPELIEKKNINITPIPDVKCIYPIRRETSPLLFDQLCSIFQIKEYNFDQKFVYFDQWFYTSKTDKEYQVYKDFSQAKFLRKIEHRTDVKILVKKHPVTKNQDYESLNFNTLNDLGIWELFLMRNNVSNSILLTLFSTAVFTPKILYDQEPYVVLMGKAIKNEAARYGISDTLGRIWNSSIEVFANNIKKSYTDSGRFFIPESIDELYDIISKVKRIAMK